MWCDLKRDEHGIIVQGDSSDPTYQDGGDSAFSTGIMAGSGSASDLLLMPQFIINNQLVRHPFQNANTGTASHNDPKATSRDQVIAFFFGIHDKPFAPIVLRSACLAYAKSWHVNGDILMPANKFYLYKCAHEAPPLWLYPLAYLNQGLNVAFSCFVNPDGEQNQAVCMNIVFGKRWIGFLNKFHPDLQFNISQYFGGWRGKPEIGIAFNQKIVNSI